MIPVIDLQARHALDRIEEAYTTVGFAVFTNCLSEIDQAIMNLWFEKMKEFFDLPFEGKLEWVQSHFVRKKRCSAIRRSCDC